MATQAAVVASALSGLERLSRDGVTEVFRFLELGGFERIVVTDENGTIIYDDRGGQIGNDLQTALKGKQIFRSRFASGAFQSSVTVPIGSQGAVIGAVSLFERDEERADIIMGVQRRIVVLSAAIGFVALVLGVMFSWLILRRFYSLADSMHIVAGGNYSYRHTVTGDDEISELGREFNSLTERLEENETQRRRFVADASHELKTPLASIRLLSDSILQNDGMDDATIREFVSDISGEAERLQRTTEKLLDLSRLDDGVKISPEPVDMKQVTLDALAGLVPLTRERRTRVETALEDGCVIMGNADDMTRVVSNLTENALKYNVPEGSIRLELRHDGDEVVLRVADTGIGIPKDERLNVFTRFYRVDKARSRASGGSGLGLSIVHDTVIAHKGTIEVGPNTPQGTVFTVRLPVAKEEETGI